MTEISGILERIVYINEENSYLVARIQEKGKRDLSTIIGNIAAQPGESLKLYGTWVNNKQYGLQFSVAKYESVVPASITGIEKYLGSGLIKGIGKIYASRIVGKFGKSTLDVIEREPEKLLEVEGIGKVRLDGIKKAWEEQKEIKKVVMFLQEHGVSTTYAVKIFKTYGNDAITIVSENPYRLAADVYGIGFKTADKIAQHMGVSRDSIIRAEEGAAYVLSELSSNGHVFYPIEDLIEAAMKILEIDGEIIKDGIKALKEHDRIVIDQDAVYLSPFYYAETSVADRLALLMAGPKRDIQINVDKAIVWVEGKNKIQLAERQKEAIRKSVREKIMVITGNPGCGKSTLVKSIIDILGKKEISILLAAPTGRAAQRLSELAGMEAKTIHRLLEFKKMRFQRNQDNPLDADLVVIDEASMIDILLMNNLLKAIPPWASLILVGDVDQLPSVGPGNVFKDIINSGVVPVVSLTEIFRQASNSMIIVNANRINKGERPFLKNREDQDFFFIEEDDPERVAEQIVSLVSKRLPEHFHVDPAKDIQVLCPMHRGTIGVGNLNIALQQALNPEGAGGITITKGGSAFRITDKVMQMRNNYDLDIFNGDIGIIRGINQEDNVVVIEFDGRPVEYDFSDLDEISLAYACSIHKSQGSEYPLVVIPVHTQHYIMLQRNLIYTALTRARKVAVFVGTRKALAIAISNDKVADRFSRLKERIAYAKKPSSCISSNNLE